MGADRGCPTTYSPILRTLHLEGTLPVGTAQWIEVQCWECGVTGETRAHLKSQKALVKCYGGTNGGAWTIAFVQMAALCRAQGVGGPQEADWLPWPGPSAIYVLKQYAAKKSGGQSQLTMRCNATHVTYQCLACQLHSTSLCCSRSRMLTRATRLACALPRSTPFCTMAASEAKRPRTESKSFLDALYATIDATSVTPAPVGVSFAVFPGAAAEIAGLSHVFAGRPVFVHASRKLPLR